MPLLPSPTNSMEMSHSWEAVSCAATQEFPNIYIFIWYIPVTALSSGTVDISGGLVWGVPLGTSGSRIGATLPQKLCPRCHLFLAVGNIPFLWSCLAVSIPHRTRNLQSSFWQEQWMTTKECLTRLPLVLSCPSTCLPQPVWGASMRGLTHWMDITSVDTTENYFGPAHIRSSSLWGGSGIKVLISSTVQPLCHWGLAWCQTPTFAYVHWGVNSLGFTVPNWLESPTWLDLSFPGWFF